MLVSINWQLDIKTLYLLLKTRDQSLNHGPWVEWSRVRSSQGWDRQFESARGLHFLGFFIVPLSYVCTSMFL